jgi:AraC family transcriptional regulator
LLMGSMWFGVAAAEARSLLAGWSSAQDPSPASATVTTDGPTLFRERGCAHCHEIKGAGGDKGPDLSGVGRRMKKNAIKRQIEQGGKMATYNSQAEASQGIPQQWRVFLGEHISLEGSANFYGASPCTSDSKIHYLTGISRRSSENVVDGESLTLEAGEYAVVRVNEPALLRDTWIWLLGTWLANSGRREKNAPEFERFTSISEAGTPVGPVDIWIPLEPLVD